MGTLGEYSAPLQLAQRVADLLGSIPGVVAVVLGGSWARGHGRRDSDLDLGIYYHVETSPSVEALRVVAHELDDHHAGDAVTDFGEWGPWINGGAWLRIEGTRVDWLYRDLARVADCIEASRQGHVTIHYQPGHPFGFPSYLYMGEINYCRALYDPHSAIANLKSLVTPYPAALTHSIVERFMWEAGFALDTAQSAADRADVSYVCGCLFRCVGCLVQVLYALNGRYLINEKGAVPGADSLPNGVPGFRETSEAILGQPGTHADELRESLRRMDGVVAAVRHLAGELLREG
jgi:predicted nucleotidyltransferase